MKDCASCVMRRVSRRVVRAVFAAAVVAGFTAVAGTTTVDPEWSAGEEVVVAAGDVVELTKPTARLKSISIAGTLKMSGWSTADGLTSVRR